MRISSRVLLSGCVMLLAAALARRAAADDPSKTTPAKAPATPAVSAPVTPPHDSDAADPEIIRLHLMDGSVITGRLSLKELAVETKFGTLNVPVVNLRSFTPGLTSHPALAKKIATMIDDLGSGTFNDREAAQQALIKMGTSVRGELEKHRDDNDAERRTRVRAILADFEQAEDDQDEPAPADKADPEMASYTEFDSVVTSEFTIVGRIVPQEFSVSSLYGPLTVKLTDVRRGERDEPKKDEPPANFTVTGSHMVTSGVLRTNLRLDRGDTVTISASGSIVMTPWGNGATSSPDGSPNFGWYSGRQIPVGALVAKVGSGEDYFKVGSKHTFTADKPGILQFAIAMSPQQAGNDFPGHYSVKVRVQHK